ETYISTNTLYAIKSSDETGLTVSAGYSETSGDNAKKCMMSFASDIKPENQETWRRNARMSIKNSCFHDPTIEAIFGSNSGFKFYAAENNSRLTSYLELARKGEEENDLQRITTGLLVDPKKSTTAMQFSLDISEDISKKFKLEGRKFEDTGSVVIKISEVRDPENQVLGEISYFVKTDEYDFTIEISKNAVLDYFTQNDDLTDLKYYQKIKAVYQPSSQYFIAEIQDQRLLKRQNSTDQFVNNSTLTIPNGLKPNENGDVAILTNSYDETVDEMIYVLSMDKKQKRISLDKRDESFNILSISIAPYDVLNEEIWIAPMYDIDNINGKNVIAVDVSHPASNKPNKLRLSGGGLVNYVEDLMGLDISDNHKPGVLLVLSIEEIIPEFLLTKSNGLFHTHIKMNDDYSDSAFLTFQNIDDTTSVEAKIEAHKAIDPRTVDLFLTIGDSSELIFGYNGEYEIDADWGVDITRSEGDSIRSIELKLNPFLEINHEQKEEPMIDLKMNLEIEPEYKTATLNEFLMLIDNDVFYEFEVTHANFRMNNEHMELVAEMFHNIDFLHYQMAILPHTRIDAAADFPAHEPFKAFVMLQGAEGKHEQIYLVHDIDLKCDYKFGGLQDFYGTGSLKTTSPILPEEISFNILADLDDGSRIEVGYNMTGGTEEKNRALHGARFGQLEFSYSNDGELKTLLDLAEGSARVDGQVTLNVDSGFKEISLDFKVFDETFELLLNTSDSFLSSEVYISRAEEEIVRISYDFENSHKEGIVLNILEIKNKIIVNEDWENSRLIWVLETKGDHHNFKNSGLFVKRPNYKLTTSTFLSGFGLEDEHKLTLFADLLEEHDSSSEEKYTLAMVGQYNEHMAQLTPMMAIRYKTYNQYGNVYKDGAPIGGSMGLKWSMPTCKAFHSFSTEASVDIDGRVGGGLEVQVNENEPIKLDVRYVGLEKGATFGFESKLVGIMQHVDDRIIKEWMLARSSVDVLVSLDWSLHTYSLTVTPDGQKYHFRGSYERDGVTIYFTQPNQIENIPTWGSIHCEGGSDSDDECHFSCNAKALVNDITRELNTKFSSLVTENAIYNVTSNVDEFHVLYRDEIHGKELWSLRRETKSDGFFSVISFHENEKVTDVTRELFNANGSRIYDSNIRLIIEGDRADDGALEFKFGLKIGKHDYTVNVRHFAERKERPGVLVFGSESYLNLAGSKILIQGTFVELYKDYGQTGIRFTVNECLARFIKKYIIGEKKIIDEARFYLFENFGDFAVKIDQITKVPQDVVKNFSENMNPMRVFTETFNEYTELVKYEMGVDISDEIEKILEKFFYIGDAEIFMAIPINIPDQMPEDFDLAAAIRASAPVQIAGNLADVDFWVDIWFHIRAFIAKERAPFSGRAWIVENKYVRTFDGGDGIVNGDVFIQDNLRNEKMSIEQYTIYDFSVMDDVVCVRDDCQPQMSHKVIEINLPWTMFGNIEGSFGTMSREIADDFLHIEKRNTSSVEACPVESLRPRNARRALRPCLPIVDIEPFRKMLLEEDCNTISSCSIMDYYVRRCAAEGILIKRPRCE
ncbi:unnamed protein product, partial [Oikopleura dioica]